MNRHCCARSLNRVVLSRKEGSGTSISGMAGILGDRRAKGGVLNGFRIVVPWELQQVSRRSAPRAKDEVCDSIASIFSAAWMPLIAVKRRSTVFPFSFFRPLQMVVRCSLDKTDQAAGCPSSWDWHQHGSFGVGQVSCA
jgi:hypothetical protein